MCWGGVKLYIACFPSSQCIDHHHNANGTTHHSHPLAGFQSLDGTMKTWEAPLCHMVLKLILKYFFPSEGFAVRCSEHRSHA